MTPVNQVLPFAVEEPYPTSIDGVPMETYMDWMQSCYTITVTEMDGRRIARLRVTPIPAPEPRPGPTGMPCATAHSASWRSG